MTGIKAIDKLRELADKLDESAARMSEHGFSPLGLRTAILCDEIEREIEERYMEKPRDADGVVISAGDLVQFRHDAPVTVKALSAGFRASNGSFFGIGTFGELRHVKTETEVNR